MTIEELIKECKDRFIIDPSSPTHLVYAHDLGIHDHSKGKRAGQLSGKPYQISVNRVQLEVAHVIGLISGREDMHPIVQEILNGTHRAKTTLMVTYRDGNFTNLSPENLEVTKRPVRKPVTPEVKSAKKAVFNQEVHDFMEHKQANKELPKVSRAAQASAARRLTQQWNEEAKKQPPKIKVHLTSYMDNLESEAMRVIVPLILRSYSGQVSTVMEYPMNRVAESLKALDKHCKPVTPCNFPKVVTAADEYDGYGYRRGRHLAIIGDLPAEYDHGKANTKKNMKRMANMNMAQVAGFKPNVRIVETLAYVNEKERFIQPLHHTVFFNVFDEVEVFTDSLDTGIVKFLQDSYGDLVEIIQPTDGDRLRSKVKAYVNTENPEIAYGTITATYTDDNPYPEVVLTKERVITYEGSSLYGLLRTLGSSAILYDTDVSLRIVSETLRLEYEEWLNQ